MGDLESILEHLTRHHIFANTVGRVCKLDLTLHPVWMNLFLFQLTLLLVIALVILLLVGVVIVLLIVLLLNLNVEKVQEDEVAASKFSIN